MTVKTCSACHQTLPLTEFYTDRSKKDGFRAQCKKCFDTKTRICLACHKQLSNKFFGRFSVLCNSCAATLKRCPTCRQIKPHSAFYKNPSQTDGLDPHCIECKREWQASYRSTPKQKQRDKLSRQQYQQTQSYKDSQRRYRQTEKGRIVMRRGWRKYYYSETGQKTIKRSYKRWIQSPNGRTLTRHWAKRWRAAKFNNGGSHTLLEFQTLCDMFGNQCLCCGQKVKLTEDHIIPLSRGGSDDISNIQPLCQSCNSSKNNRAIDYRPVRVTRHSLREWSAREGRPLPLPYQQLPIPHLLK